MKSMIKVQEADTFKAWIKGLKDKIAQSIINARIRRLSAGNFGNTKSVGGNVSELIIDYGPGYRVYYTRRGREIVVLLCGGDKSSQSRDIEEAKQIASNLGGIE